MNEETKLCEDCGKECGVDCRCALDKICEGAKEASSKVLAAFKAARAQKQGN